MNRKQAFQLLEDECKRELANCELALNRLREEAALIVIQRDKVVATLDVIAGLRTKKNG